MLKPMIKQSLHMAWPIVGNRVLVAVSNFYAMWLLALLGPNELAAGALVFGVQTMVTVVMQSILFSIAPIASRAHGAKDHQKIGAILQQGWLIALCLMLPTLVILWFAEPILLFLHQSPDLAAIVGEYFRVYVFAVIPMYFFSTNQMLMTGVGKQHLALMATMMATVVLFAVTYPLAFGGFGLPALGVKGVALGMVCSIWTGFFCSLLYLQLKQFAPFEFFRWRIRSSFSYAKQIIAIGWPISLQVGGELLCWFVTTMFIGLLGAESLAAKQIVNQFNILTLIPIMGFSQASSILVGQAGGAKRYHEVQKFGWINMGLGFVMMLVVLVIYLVMPKLLISVFLNPAVTANAQIVHLSVLLFAISGVVLVFDGVRNIAMGSLRGVYDSRYPMILSLTFIWLVALPLGYVLAFHFKMGVIGFSLGNCLAVSIAALVLLWRWHTRVDQLLHKADLHDAKHIKGHL